jgi:hypothetical protein
LRPPESERASPARKRADRTESTITTPHVCREATAMTHELNVLALVKDSERYIFLYDEESSDTLLQTLGRFAADKDLSFTWYDAAVLSQKVRRMQDEADAEAREQWSRKTTW